MSPERIEAIAQACHEANRTFCQLLGDETQLSWHQASEWQRVAVRKSVEFALANPLAPPEALHEEWRRVKEADGWACGVYDVHARLHPCMVPWEELPPDQQVKDIIFRRTVVRVVSGWVSGVGGC